MAIIRGHCFYLLLLFSTQRSHFLHNLFSTTIFTKTDKDYAKSTSVYENTRKIQVQEGTIVPEQPQLACQRHCSQGTLEPERKYRLAWIHCYDMNSLTFLAIRHKGEHDHCNWPTLSCQLWRAHPGTAWQALAKALSLPRAVCWAEGGCSPAHSTPTGHTGGDPSICSGMSCQSGSGLAQPWVCQLPNPVAVTMWPLAQLLGTQKPR